MVPYAHRRGPRSRFAALAAAGNLNPGQVYVLVDEGRLAVAITASTYETFAKQSEVPATALKEAFYLEATGTGALQDITIPAGYLARDVEVFEDGIRQRPGAHYTVSGTTLTGTFWPGSTIILTNPGGSTGATGAQGAAGNMSGSNNLNELTNQQLAQQNLGLRFATAAEARAGTADRIVKAQAMVAMGQLVALTPGAVPDFSAFINGTMTLTANAAFPNPAAGSLAAFVGRSGFITVTQGGAGGFKLTLGDQYWTVDGAAITFTATAGAVDRLYYTITSDSTIDVLVVKNVQQIIPYGEEARLAFAAMSTQPSKARKQLYSDLIDGLKADGVWALLDSLYILAAHDAQASRINLKRPAVVATVANNPTFTVDRGWRAPNAGATHGLCPNENLFGSSLNWKTGGAGFMGVWLNSITNATSSYPDIAETNRYFSIAVTTSYLDCRYAGSGVLQASASPTPGMFTITRPDQASGSCSFIKDTTTYTTTSVSDYNGPQYWSMGNRGSIGSANESSTNQQAACFVGGPGMTPAMVAKLYGRLQTYLTAVGGA